MEIKYERDVSHCSVSTYVKELTISKVKPAINSDKLDAVSFLESGRFAVVGRNAHKVGDKIFFIPAESVLPIELSEKLNITKLLSSGRVRSIRLRGNRSEGIVVNKDIVEPYLPYIIKWEDPPIFGGNIQRSSDTPPEFSKFKKIHNLLDEPHTFEREENIVILEKYNGTNSRFGWFPHPKTEELTFYVGSHTVVIKEDENNLFWNIGHKYKDLFKNYPEHIFFGEIYGSHIIPSMPYDKGIALVIFAIMKDMEYLPYYVVEKICQENEIPYVKPNYSKFSDLEDIREWADKPSEATSSHHREGVVVVSLDNPNKMSKVIGFDYLTKTKNRVERH